MTKFEQDMIEFSELASRMLELCREPQPGLYSWQSAWSEVCSGLYQKLNETKGD